jgi:eukaryotic-like serine/threonine-protein kinase
MLQTAVLLSWILATSRYNSPTKGVSFAPGTRVAHYEVQSLLGAGGMGEVYRATDTHLKRQVAIKVLPAAVANDPDRLARFQREAEVLASLNHPNIAQIYGLEKSGGVNAIIMELVDGLTLSDRIASGPMPPEEALPIAKQIAEALEAAHDRGILHRDLKPANVKVRPDGSVKVLDFGLAKAFAVDGVTRSDVQLTNSPTLTSPVVTTHAGVLIGTAPYMSPEQARGNLVDQRTDIWAFGCVCYEMLTGRRAFQGDDVSTTLAEVIKGEPDWRGLPVAVPTGVRAALMRCLHKDPRQRMRDIGDMRLALDGAFDITPPPDLSALPLAQSRVRTVLPWLAAIALVGTAGAAGGWMFRRPTVSPVIATEISLPNLAATTASRRFALAPDGHSLVFVAQSGGRSRLMRRDLSQLAPVAISGTDNDIVASPFFSPDGQWIGFVAGSPRSLRIYKVPVSGGASVLVSDKIVAVPRPPVWATDNAIYFSAVDGFMTVPASGGQARVVGPPGLFGAQPLPGGRALLFDGGVNGESEGAIETLVVASGERRKLTTGTDPVYVPTGHLLFARRDGSLWAAPFDSNDLKLTGEPRPLSISTTRFTSVGSAQFAVAPTGTLVYLPSGIATIPGSLLWVDRHGSTAPALVEPGRYAYPRLSPDATRVAVSLDEDIWVIDLQRSTPTRLTRERHGGGSSASQFVWTPDGQRVTYMRGRLDPARGDLTTIESVKADGSESPHVLLTPEDLSPPGSWSPDGLALAYQRYQGGFQRGNRDIWILRPGPPVSDQPLVATPANERAPTFSRDGRWIAYVSNQSGMDEVYVQPYGRAGDRQTVSSRGGTEPVWSRDGHELFYRRGDTMMAVSVTIAGPTLSMSSPQRLFAGSYLPDTSVAAAYPNYDVAPDGRFLMVSPAPATTASVVVVHNWFEELKRLVPTK